MFKRIGKYLDRFLTKRQIKRIKKRREILEREHRELLGK